MEAGEIARAKGALRQELRARRMMIAEGERVGWSRGLAAGLRGHRLWAEAEVVAGFVGAKGEPDTLELLQGALDEGKQLWLPRVIGRSPPRLQWHAMRDLGTLVRGSFGLLEPPSENEGQESLAMCGPSLVLVPGLGFERNGRRLGYGGGFYDAALDGLGGAVRAGVAFEAFVLEAGSIPTEAHDQRVDWLVTERGVHIAT